MGGYFLLQSIIVSCEKQEQHPAVDLATGNQIRLWTFFVTEIYLHFI